MKKIIVSAAAAVMALSTTASALEDIKVNGQAKVWYETNNVGDNELFDVTPSTAEVVFKLGMTGKQGDVGFGTTIYQGSTMGLEGKIVSGTRTNAANGDMFVGEAYITTPIAPDTVLKFGKQELDTPLAFTERWNAMPNTFNAAVALNSSIENLTLAAAYVGQSNTGIAPGSAGSFKVNGDVNDQYYGGAVAIAALYKTDALAVNFWGYHLENVLTNGAAGKGVSVEAAWVDAAMKLGPVNAKVYGAWLTHDLEGAEEDTTAVAGSVSTKVSDITLFGAAAMVNGEEGALSVANTATGFKKTKLPTAGVYTDGQYVAAAGATSWKVKASTKLGSTGLALQAVGSMNDNEMAVFGKVQNTQEVDLIVSQKLGNVNLKGLVIHRQFSGDDAEDASGGQHVRVIASVNF